MCGRYVSAARRVDLEEQYQTTGPGDGTEQTPSWNVVPTNKIYAVVENCRRWRRVRAGGVTGAAARA